MSEVLEELPDRELIAAVREGDVAAFGVLYERHLVSAKRAAACLAGTTAEREDLVAEAFTRVLRMLREGRGPDEEFRPYLLVTLRNAAINAFSRGAAVSLCADVPEVSPVAGADDPVIDRWHATVAADAFASLPERWRLVLWHTEVENESPATVAPLLGMRPNSVAALAYRAREGLRQAYLRMHMAEPPRRECRPTVNKLAGFVRHSIPQPLTRKIDRHLRVCDDCRARADALTRVNAEIGALVGPVVLGAPLAAVYLKASGVLSGAVSTAVGGAVSGVVSGTAVTVATDAATTVSGLVAAKAAVVQVAAALVVAATAVTATSSVPANEAPDDSAAVADGVRSMAAAANPGPLGRSVNTPAPPPSGRQTASSAVPGGAGGANGGASGNASENASGNAANGTGNAADNAAAGAGNASDNPSNRTPGNPSVRAPGNGSGNASNHASGTAADGAANGAAHANAAAAARRAEPANAAGSAASAAANTPPGRSGGQSGR